MTRPNGPTKKQTTTESTTDDLSRRSFLRQGSALSAAASVGFAASSARGDSVAKTLNVGIVGTGGRGGGAARDTLSINPNVRLIAMADLNPEKCHSMRKRLTRRFNDRVAVTDENIFGGLDGYRHVIEHPDVDIVLLTTPPGFRPSYLKEAVDAGKHVFAEKPTCVDPAGYRVCLDADRKAREQGTAIVTGTQYRRQKNYMEVMRRIHEGAIGDVISATSRYCTSGIWNRPRKPGMSDVEYQLTNWMHFIWLSGDQIVEQAVHNIDAMNWLMGGPPDTAYGSGGRFTRPKGSQMWDNVSIDYAYPGNRLLSFQCRQIPNTQGENGSIVFGSEGIAVIGAINKRASITDRSGKEIWSMKGDISAAYRQEHKDLVDSISAGKPIVELAETAASSLTAVMGRLAAYTGEQVDWDFVAQQSTLDLFPKELKIDESLPIASYAVPGVTKLT